MQLDYNTERRINRWDIFSPVKYAETVLQSRVKEPKLYPQTANENPSKIEGAV